MALVFTDNQLRELTGQVANSDATIKALNEQKVLLQKNKNDYKDLDDQEKVFTEHWINIINKFHNELKYINSTQKTSYQQSAVDSSAKLETTSLHFPTGYPNFKPKLDNSNIGLPETILSEANETSDIAKCLEWIDRIVNGFMGLPNSGTGTYAGGSITITGSPAGTIPSGVPIVAYSNNAAIWGIVGSFTSTIVGTPLNTTTVEALTITIVESYGVLNGSINWMLSRSGFPESTRIGTSSDGFLLLCKDAIDRYKNSTNQFVLNQNIELNANDSKVDKSTIDSSKSQNTTFTSNLSNWSNYPSQTRFNTANLTSLSGYLNNRQAYLPNRINAINTSLGNVTQSANGDFTGSGIYLDLFNSIMLRTHKITGYLRNYYQQGLLEQSTNEKIYVATTQADRNNGLAIVKLFSSEPTNTQIVELKDISKLSTGDAIAVMDNKYSIINRYTITELIQPNKVKLSDVVPTNYKMEFQVRLVKMT